MTCRTVALVATQPMTATLSDLDAPAGSVDDLLRYRHEQWMRDKERRWCSKAPGHDGDHDFTLTEPVD